MTHAPERPPQPGTPHAAVADAFRQLHAGRLHGFALLLTLGDRARAAALTEQALSAAVDRITELRHPERAAAWLRERVTRAAPRRPPPMAVDRRLAALEPIGVTRPILAGLAALDRAERAALIVATLERLDRRDVADVVHREGRSLEALLATAHRRYLSAHAEVPAERDVEDGQLMSLVREAAARAMP